jgi:hypothetical protein
MQAMLRKRSWPSWLKHQVSKTASELQFIMCDTLMCISWIYTYGEEKND